MARSRARMICSSLAMSASACCVSLRDTADFIAKIQNLQWEETYIMVGFDAYITVVDLMHANIFCKQEYFKQIQGTAMGTCFAASYANLLMVCWAEQAFWAVDLVLWTEKVVVWLRYINDIFCIWNEHENDLKQFPKV
ncbi:hypothetical protein NDU88_001932 [Pleurodeles waltl]|uniref:Uncharacterized protein n=1 Tax=Pleurodeles waltl TaxID=8319 RepID=A0AAV7R8I9_PLEWA|nr:hypothetical protein NDU88_001932 [Pleurodeles waltl]